MPEDSKLLRGGIPQESTILLLVGSFHSLITYKQCIQVGYSHHLSLEEKNALLSTGNVWSSAAPDLVCGPESHHQSMLITTASHWH